MVERVAVQVRDYTAHVVSTVEPITMDEIIGRPVGEVLVRPVGVGVTKPRNTSGGWVAGLAASFIVVVVGLVTWFAGTSADVGPAVSSEPATSAVGLPTTQVLVVMPELSIYADNVTWRRYEFASERGGAPTVDRYLDGYVMSGHQGGLLYSNDGIEWTTESDDSGLDDYRYFQSRGSNWGLAYTTGPWLLGGNQLLLRHDGQRWVVAEEGEIPPSDLFTYHADDTHPWELVTYVPIEVLQTRPVTDAHDPAWTSKAASGYVYAAYDQEVDRVRFWHTTDGSRWDEIQGVDIPDGNFGVTSMGAVDNMLYAGWSGDTAVLWVGHFEP